MRSPTKWTVQVKTGEDWFDLEGGVVFQDELVAIPELLEAARKRGGLVKLGNGKVGLLPERWLEQWGLLELAQKRDDDAVRFQRSQGILLDSFLAERELELVADEGFETLRANMACVAPHLKGNEALNEEVDMARELLDRGLADSPDVATELTERIEQAYLADESIDKDKVQARIERMLLSRRAFQKRSLLGGTWLRALLSQPQSAPLPCYIPEAFADDIPLFSRFAARAIGELHAQQDQYESNTMALRVISLGRVIGVQEGE